MKLTTDDRKALQGAVRVLVEILQQASPEVAETNPEHVQDTREGRAGYRPTNTRK